MQIIANYGTKFSFIVKIKIIHTYKKLILHFYNLSLDEKLFFYFLLYKKNINRIRLIIINIQIENFNI